MTADADSFTDGARAGEHVLLLCFTPTEGLRETDRYTDTDRHRQTQTQTDTDTDTDTHRHTDTHTHLSLIHI